MIMNSHPRCLEKVSSIVLNQRNHTRWNDTKYVSNRQNNTHGWWKRRRNKNNLTHVESIKVFLEGGENVDLD